MNSERNESSSSRRSNLRQRTIVLAGTIIFVLAGTATFLGVYLTQNDDNGSHGNPEFQTQEGICDDIAIIGAGIGGSYIAWKLRDRNMSISVYEYSDRVGGRLHTVRFRDTLDVNIELGGMRFIPSYHILLNETAHSLGLTIVDFKPGVGWSDDTLMYVRGKHFRRSEATKSGPYNLKYNERVKDDIRLRWEVFVNETDYNATKKYNENSTAYIKTRDNIPLYQQSVRLAYTTMDLSNEAYDLFRDTLAFYSFMDDTVASLAVPVRNPDVPSYPTSVKTIKEGMDQIPKKLIEEFLNYSARHSLRKNYRLRKISKSGDGGHHLDFQKTETYNDVTADSDNDISSVSVCARKVVLAVPKMALSEIEWEGLKQTEIKDILENSSKNAPAAKVFLAYNEPWWRNLKLATGHTVSDLPNRQTYDFGTSHDSNKSVLLAVYADMEDVKIWRELQSLGKSFSNCSLAGWNCISEKAVEYVHKYLAEIFNISVSNIPYPIDGALVLWDSYPYGAAWHVWKPGYLWRNVQDKMIQPIPSEDVFISSGIFTSGEGDSWSESALSSAEVVLTKL